MPKSTRGRKPRACDSCRRKKVGFPPLTLPSWSSEAVALQRAIQCDRAVPQCDYCQHHGLTCSYNQAAKTEGSAIRYAEALAISLRHFQLTDYNRSRFSRLPKLPSPNRQLSPSEQDDGELIHPSKNRPCPITSPFC
ncbi:hypothetical protein CEK25_013567 [Fusarium fujikuroi]|nr:hypothetical protein CEK25_013567 [Fusarium fujikuroi]